MEHLVIADSAYFPDLKNIAEGNFKMDLREKYRPFTRLCGRLMKDRLQEQVKKKMTAPKKIRPQRSAKDLSLIEDYCKNLDAFLRLISYCKKVDVDKTIITFPTIRIVTYSLRDALSFLIQHEHRHINQAIRVKTNEGFPRK